LVLLVAILFVGLVFVGCSNPVQEPPTEPTGESTGGSADIQVTDAALSGGWAVVAYDITNNGLVDLTDWAVTFRIHSAAGSVDVSGTGGALVAGATKNGGATQISFLLGPPTSVEIITFTTTP
jgi:hypothetical protein